MAAVYDGARAIMAAVYHGARALMAAVMMNVIRVEPVCSIIAQENVISLNFHGYSWMSAIYLTRYLAGCRDIHRWVSLEIHDYAWNYMKTPGYP